MKLINTAVWRRLLWALAVVGIVGGQNVGVNDVVEMVNEMVESHLTQCHLVLLTSMPQSPLITPIVRRLGVGVSVMDGSVDEQLLKKVLWTDTRTVCRGLILHLDHLDNTTNQALGFLEQVGLWRTPETRVIILAEKSKVKSVLLNHSLRNTLNVLYLAIHPSLLNLPHLKLWKGVTLRIQDIQKRVFVYRRCMYCDAGEPGLQNVMQFNINSSNNVGPNITSLFNTQDQLKNLHGYEMKFMTSRHFPYMDYTPDTDEPMTTVTPRDSIDTRIIYTIDDKLNFTYTMREEPGRIWGVPKNGMFNGLMGRLQRQEADIITVSAPSPPRIKVAHFNSAYPSNPITIVSLKPTALPQHLVLVRPFEGEVWVAVLVGVLVWGVTLWIMQRVWTLAVGGPEVKFSNALLYGFGALLENPPNDPSINISGQMLVGWWLVCCLVILTGFKSSLIAALTIQSKSKPIETLEDLVNTDGWRWGMEPWLLSGLPYDYFSSHTDPVVQKVFVGIEPTPADVAMNQILDGGFSLISFKNYLTIMVASKYTDSRGYTPFHISKESIPITATFGWGFRIGAPFFKRIEKLVQQLKEAGIISYWIDDVIALRVTENRAAVQTDTPAETRQDDSKEVVLGLDHLQGAFYLLFLGTILSAFILLLEILGHSRHTN